MYSGLLNLFVTGTDIGGRFHGVFGGSQTLIFSLSSSLFLEFFIPQGLGRTFAELPIDTLVDAAVVVQRMEDMVESVRMKVSQ